MVVKILFFLVPTRLSQDAPASYFPRDASASEMDYHAGAWEPEKYDWFFDWL